MMLAIVILFVVKTAYPVARPLLVLKGVALRLFADHLLFMPL
jgi:hypothetical protein